MGVTSAKGTLAVSPRVGPGKLTLTDGKTIDVFVTTSGKRGSTVIVIGAFQRLVSTKVFSCNGTNVSAGYLSAARA